MVVVAGNNLEQEKFRWKCQLYKIYDSQRRHQDLWSVSVVCLYVWVRLNVIFSPLYVSLPVGSSDCLF